jgi:hypothetical protein
VVGTLFFGKMFGFLEHRSDYGTYINSLDTYLPVMAINFVLPSYLRSVLPFLGNAGFRSIQTAVKAVLAIRAASLSVVEGREEALKSGKEGRNDILSKLFKVLEKKGDDGHFQRADIVQESYVAMYEPPLSKHLMSS